MSKVIKISTLTLFSLLLCFLIYRLCYFIAEKYFFDKFFYYKSTAYGYWVPGKNIPLLDFGDRARDLDLLTPNNHQVLGIDNGNNIYKIAVIGDSLVWGQGIRNEQRFAKLLEKKLNKIKPTKIYSFGFGGDNIFDNYAKYQISIQTLDKINLYIFALYNNDLVFNTDNRYKTNLLINNLSKSCQGEAFYDQGCNPNDPGQCNLYYSIKSSSLVENSLNYCTYKHLLPLLPKENVIYIDLGSLQEKDDVQTKFSEIMLRDLNIKTIPYNNLVQTKISLREGHPSSISNHIYSDILYQEITTDQKWGFINN